jgi:hypothetical protein
MQQRIRGRRRDYIPRVDALEDRPLLSGLMFVLGSLALGPPPAVLEFPTVDGLARGPTDAGGGVPSADATGAVAGSLGVGDFLNAAVSGQAQLALPDSGGVSLGTNLRLDPGALPVAELGVSVHLGAGATTGGPGVLGLGGEAGLNLGVVLGPGGGSVAGGGSASSESTGAGVWAGLSLGLASGKGPGGGGVGVQAGGGLGLGVRLGAGGGEAGPGDGSRETTPSGSNGLVRTEPGEEANPDSVEGLTQEGGFGHVLIQTSFEGLSPDLVKLLSEAQVGPTEPGPAERVPDLSPVAGPGGGFVPVQETDEGSIGDLAPGDTSGQDDFDPEGAGPLSGFFPFDLAAWRNAVQWSLDDLAAGGWFNVYAWGLALTAAALAFEAPRRRNRRDDRGNLVSLEAGGPLAL